MPFRSPFPTRKFNSNGNLIGAWYRRNLDRHPFLLFGLPFITTIVAGSFFLTPATAIRYEHHDRRVKTLSREEELSLANNPRRRKVGTTTTAAEEYYRLAGRDLDDWEQKRVKRLKGEPDGRV